MIINKLNLHFRKMRSLCILLGTCLLNTFNQIVAVSNFFMSHSYTLYVTIVRLSLLKLYFFPSFFSNFFYFIRNFLFPNDKSFHLFFFFFLHFISVKLILSYIENMNIIVIIIIRFYVNYLEDTKKNVEYRPY